MWSSLPVRRAALGAIGLTVVLSSRCLNAAESPPPFIQYGNDMLTVRLREVPVSEVLQEIAGQSGAQIRGSIREPRQVTADFQAVPLAEALSRLLGDQNFALVYGKGGRLKAVRLLGGGEVVVEAGSSPPSTAAPPVAERQPFPGSLPELIDRHPPVPVDGQVAAALGSRSATLRQLLELSLHSDDASVRAEAMRTGIAAVEAEPDLRSAVVSELQSADVALLTSMLRGAVNERAEGVVTQVLENARMADIRVKASAVLQRLRTGG